MLYQPQSDRCVVNRDTVVTLMLISLLLTIFSGFYDQGMLLSFPQLQNTEKRSYSCFVPPDEGKPDHDSTRG